MHTPEVSTPTRMRWFAMGILLLPVLLVSIDNTVLSFALPQISKALAPSGNQLLWIIDIYPLVLAALLVPMGSLADRVGRRKLLLIGSLGFAGVSAIATYSTSAEALIAARAAMAPIVYGIKELAGRGLTLTALVTVAVGLSSGTLFVRRQLRRDIPMLDVRLFSVPSFGGGVLVNFLSVVALTGFLYFASQGLQLVIGLRPMEAGLALLPGLFGAILAGLGVVWVVQRVSPGIVVAGALAFAAAGYVVIAIGGANGTLAPLLIAFTLLSIGAGAGETVSNDLILSSAPANKAGAASAISETAYELGAVTGTAVLGGILSASYRRGVVVPEGLDPERATQAGQTLGGAVHVADLLPPDQAGALLDSAHTAFASGVALTSWIGVALISAAIVVSLKVLRKPAVAPPEAVPSAVPVGPSAEHVTIV